MLSLGLGLPAAAAGTAATCCDLLWQMLPRRSETVAAPGKFNDSSSRDSIAFGNF